MKKIMMFGMSLILSFQVLAAPADIIGGQADRYIKVVSKGELRSFSFCSRHNDTCEQLGSKKWYRLQNLEQQRMTEVAQAIGSSVVTAAGGIAIFYGSFFILGLSGAVTGSSALFGTSAALGAGSMTLSSITDLGPIEQFKQQYIIRSKVINDQEIKLESATDEEMEEIAERLETVLDKI